MIETIYAIILAAAPAFAAVIGIIASVVKIKNNNKESNMALSNKIDESIESFETVRREVMNTKEYESLKTQLAIAHQENIDLKKQLNELLTKIDGISRKE